MAPPYVVLRDFGTTPRHDFEHHPIEETRLAFLVYAPTLAQADAVADAIRTNGQPAASAAGMDFAASLPLTGQTFHGMTRGREQRSQEAARGGGGGLVFRVSMEYAVAAVRTG